MTVPPVGTNSYVLIADTNSDRIARTVRECVETLPVRLLVARDGDDAVRMVAQLGAPMISIVALSLPGKDGLSVIDALRRLDDGAAIVAFADDRELREFTACRLSNARVKILGAGVQPAVLKRVLESMLHRTADVERGHPNSLRDLDRPKDEDWSVLAERAREALSADGAAVYAKTGDDDQYRLSVIWTPDSPMPSIPEELPALLEQVIEDGASRVWPDAANEGGFGSAGATLIESLRSLAIVPIRRGAEIAGALCAFDSRPRAIRESDVDTLMAIARSGFGSTAVVRRRLTSSPVDRDVAGAAIAQEVARARREQVSLSVILLAASLRSPQGAEAPAASASVSVTDMFAGGVRGSDLIVRWTNSEILLVLVGVGAGLARRIAERIRTIAETNGSNRVAVSGAVSELRTADSFDAMVARAEERLRGRER
jgi:CheY-like chemotaxis protein